MMLQFIESMMLNIQWNLAIVNSVLSPIFFTIARFFTIEGFHDFHFFIVLVYMYFNNVFIYNLLCIKLYISYQVSIMNYFRVN